MDEVRGGDYTKTCMVWPVVHACGLWISRGLCKDAHVVAALLALASWVSWVCGGLGGIGVAVWVVLV